MSIKLTLVGDICPAPINDVFKAENTDTLFGNTLSYIQNADRAICNLECAITDKDTPIAKIGPNLRTSPEAAKVLKKAGFTDCSIANNHVFDYGVEGMRDTIASLEAQDINWFGFGENELDARKNLIIEKEGKKIAIISVCEHEYCYALPDRMGTRGFDVIDTISDVTKAKQDNDFVIVLFHGGKEQCLYPSPRLRKVCRALARSGADAVFCQHSHCIGCYENYNGSHILYGQGNFHFLKLLDHPHWKSGLIASITVTDKMELELIPTVALENGIVLAEGDEKKAILDAFAKQSEALKTDAWLDGWREFCLENTEKYLDVIKKAYSDGCSERDIEMFAHYLRCEAHHDVWDEICKLSWETRKEIKG